MREQPLEERACLALRGPASRAHRRARTSTAGTRPHRPASPSTVLSSAVAYRMTKPSCIRSRWIRSTVPTTRGSSGGRNPTSGISSVAASRLGRAVALRERVQVGVEALPADLVVDLAPDPPPAVDGAREVEALDGVDRTVERHPGEHLRVHEVAARPAHLPDPLVRLVPGALEEVHHPLLERPRVAVGREPVPARLVQRVDQLAVHVELKLLVRRVADPDRLRAGVPGQPVELVLVDPPLAGDAVEDLQLRRDRRRPRAAASRATHAPRRCTRRSSSRRA